MPIDQLRPLTFHDTFLVHIEKGVPSIRFPGLDVKLGRSPGRLNTLYQHSPFSHLLSLLRPGKLIPLPGIQTLNVPYFDPMKLVVCGT